MRLVKLFHDRHASYRIKLNTSKEAPESSCNVFPSFIVKPKIYTYIYILYLLYQFQHWVQYLNPLLNYMNVHNVINLVLFLLSILRNKVKTIKHIRDSRSEKLSSHEST